MNRLSLALALLLAFVIGCAAASTFMVPPLRADQHAQKWEYFCIKAVTKNDIKKKLNKAGQEGWELVAAAARGGGSSSNTYEPVWCMKRPR